MTDQIDAMLAAETEHRLELMRKAMEQPRDPKAYINPLNPYTGEVSGLAIMENIRNGYTGFPEGLGNTRR